VQLNYEHPKTFFQHAYAGASEANIARTGESNSEKGMKLECCFQKMSRSMRDFFWKIVTCSFRKE